MTYLTNDMIISDLNVIKQTYNSTTFLYIITVALVFIISNIMLKRKNKPISLSKNILFIIVIIIPILSTISNLTSINYSLKNNTWHVEIDTINSLTKEKTFLRRTQTRYYANLKEYGKVSIPKKGYDNLPKNQDAYIVILEDAFGNSQVTRLIYPTNSFSYSK